MVSLKVMSKKSTKKGTKWKKHSVEFNIRTDIWSLSLTKTQRSLATLTVTQYRQLLKPLVLLAYWNWGMLSGLSSKERINALEKLIHRTSDNPEPKYDWYFKKAVNNHPSFRKFPSYLRRAAIAGCYRYCF